MPYISNKPHPTPGHLLPMPGTSSIILNEPDIKLGTKRKFISAESGTYLFI